MIATLLACAAISLILGLMAWATIELLSAKNRPSITRRAGFTVAIGLSLAALPFAGLSAYMIGFLAWGQPAPEARKLGDGVGYRREVFNGPRRIVAHVLEVDLTRGVRIVVSPPTDGLMSEAMTATQSIDRLKADAVINANFFHPFRESHPFDYSPHSGELVQSLGMAVGQGRRYGEDAGSWVTFWSEPGGTVGFGDPPGEADAAVSGMDRLVWRGENVVKDPGKPYPRTALGVDEGRGRLWLVVIDGKQPRYSAGMTLDELADLFIRLGAVDAIQLDGGGSSTLAARDDQGRAVLLSRPCHTKIPGRQRPVANFLGVVFPR